MLRQLFSVHFAAASAYISRSVLEGSDSMRDRLDPQKDLDDLIFGENDGLPSDR